MLPTLPMPPWWALPQEWVMGEMVEAPLGTQPLLLALIVCTPWQDSEQSSASSSLGPQVLGRPPPALLSSKAQEPVKSEGLMRLAFGGAGRPLTGRRRAAGSQWPLIACGSHFH